MRVFAVRMSLICFGLRIHMRVFAVQVSLSCENGCNGIVGHHNINVYTSSDHEYVHGDSQPLEPSI